MEKHGEIIPNPGSDAALARGCTCPVLDNGHGNPELGRLRGFVMRADCPLHGFAEDAPEKEEIRHGQAHCDTQG